MLHQKGNWKSLQVCCKEYFQWKPISQLKKFTSISWCWYRHYPIFFVEWHLMKIRWTKLNEMWKFEETDVLASIWFFQYNKHNYLPIQVQKKNLTRSHVIRKAKIITASKVGLLLLRAILFNLFLRKKIAGPHFHSLWSGDTLMYFNEKA